MTVAPDSIRLACPIIAGRKPAPGLLLPIRCFHEKGKPDQPPILEWIDPTKAGWIEAVVEIAQQADERGIACYCIPGLSRGRRAGGADIEVLPTLVLDFDVGRVSEKVARVIAALGTPTMAVWSGGVTPEGERKTHLWYRLEGDIAALNVARLRATAARVFDADPSFAKPAQPLRLPGSVHHKGEPVLVTVAYTSPNVLDTAKAKSQLENLLSSTARPTTQNDSRRAHPVPRDGMHIDDVLGRFIETEGKSGVTRYDAMTKIMGMHIHQISDLDNVETVEREFGYVMQYAHVKIEHFARDMARDARKHWNKLIRLDRARRAGPPRPPLRAQPRTRLF